jgi:hypothetical protein
MERSFNVGPLPCIMNSHEVGNFPEKGASGDNRKTWPETPYYAGEDGNDLVPE